MSGTDRQGLIGAYVLGLMEPEARAEFETQMAEDEGLDRAVLAFAARMQALDDTAPPQAPGAELWPKILARLDAPSRTDTAPAPAARRPLPPRPRQGFAPAPRRMAPATMAAAAMLLIGLGIGLLTGPLLSPPADRPVAVAVMATEADGLPGVLVEAYADDSVVLTPLIDLGAEPGRVLQVWTLPDPETGPVSLGTITFDGPVRLGGPDLPLPLHGQLYEITSEPEPGSPTGRPTGPILVKGLAVIPVDGA